MDFNLARLISSSKINFKSKLKLLESVDSFESIQEKPNKWFMSLGLSIIESFQLQEEISKFVPKKYVFSGLNLSAISIFDDKYPVKLKNISKPPMIVFYYGKIDLLNSFSIGVVGSRKASKKGLNSAYNFAHELSLREVTVVSGMALGIDAMAHKGALEAKGNTIGVLGCGLDIVYPSTNASIYRGIIETGLLISEYPPGTLPFKYNFPARNRIICGISEGLLVVEASERSGSLITANICIEEGREVFAIPGSIDSFNSVGTNKLIQSGAKLVQKPSDILDEFSYITFSQEDSILSNISENEKLILSGISLGYNTVDQLYDHTNINMTDLLSSITMLEISGLIKCDGNDLYIRKKS